MKIRAILFDMDGLMFDTERIHERAWIRVGKEAGLEFNEDFLSGVRGSSVVDTEKRFKEFFGDSIDYISLRKTRREYVNQEIAEKGVPLKKGLIELLTFLKANNFASSLATSTYTRYAMTLLEMTGVTSYFNAFVCGDMVSKNKPNPEIFYKAAEKLGCSVEECIVLEDSILGIQAAINGGFAAVMIPDLSEPDIELEAKLFAKCESLLEVIPLLDKNRF